MKAKFLVALTFMALLIAANAQATTTPTVPLARAAVMHELRSFTFLQLHNMRVACTRLTTTLFRCKWSMREDVPGDHIALVGGKAKVKFYPYAADVTFYDFDCYAYHPNVADCSSEAVRPH